MVVSSLLWTFDGFFSLLKGTLNLCVFLVFDYTTFSSPLPFDFCCPTAQRPQRQQVKQTTEQLSLVSGSLRSLAGLWRFVLTNIKNEERTELSLDSQDNKTLTAEIEKRNQLSITLGPTKSTTGSKKRKEPTGQGVRCPDPDCHIFLGRGRSNGGHIESCLFSAHYPRGVRESTHLPIARRDYTVAAIAFYNEHRMMVKERRRRV